MTTLKVIHMEIPYPIFTTYTLYSAIYNLLMWLVLKSPLCTLQWTGLVFYFTIYEYFHLVEYRSFFLVPRLVATVTSNNTLLARVKVTVTRPWCSTLRIRGEWGRRWGVGGGEGRDKTAVKRRGGSQDDKSRRAGGWGNRRDHVKPLPFVERVLGYVRLYGKCKRGEGGNGRRQKDPSFWNHWGGASSFTRTPPPLPPSFQVLPGAQVERSKISSTGASGPEESQAANQALVGAHQEAYIQWRFTVADGGEQPRSLENHEEWRRKRISGARGQGRGGRVWASVGGYQEGISRFDLDGDKRGNWIQVGKSD